MGLVENMFVEIIFPSKVSWYISTHVDRVEIAFGYVYLSEFNRLV